MTERQWRGTFRELMAALKVLAALNLALLVSACTFYTGPPTQQGPIETGQSGTGGMAAQPTEELDGGEEPNGTWLNVTSNLAGLRSGCGNLALVSAHPTIDMLVAAVSSRGLWSSTDGGKSWKALGLGALSTPVENVATSIVYDPATPEVFWETGINGPIGILETADAGKHFRQRGTSNNHQLLSVDFTDPDRNTQLVGGHGEKQALLRSRDAGATWDDIGAAFPADADAPSYPLVISDSTYLVGAPHQIGGDSGIYLSTDAGETWDLVSSDGGQSPPLVTSRAIYWSSAEGGGLVKSTDGGKSFKVLVGPGRLQSFSPIGLPDGKLVAVSANHIVASADEGATWRFVSARLPYAINGFTYSEQQRAFFVWRSTCSGESPVPRNAIMRFDFDYASAGK